MTLQILHAERIEASVLFCPVAVNLVTKHTVSDFVEALNRFTSKHLAEEIFENRQLTSTTNGILKAEAVRLFAIAIQEAGIEKFADVEDLDKLEKSEKRITKMKGQTSGLSFDYFALLAGNQVVKADRSWPKPWGRNGIQIVYEASERPKEHFSKVQQGKQCPSSFGSPSSWRVPMLVQSSRAFNSRTHLTRIKWRRNS